MKKKIEVLKLSKGDVREYNIKNGSEVPTINISDGGDEYIVIEIWKTPKTIVRIH